MTAATPRIVGNYALGDLLGRGGTSEVYAAQHRFLGDNVALKLLRPELASEPAIVDAFVAEAARTREIGHPNVVRVLDFGRDEATASCYLVMDRITGGSLSARLERRGRLDEAELRRLCEAIADGLAAAHARGIVHRDLKPGNVMMNGDVPTIVDFGIAKSLGEGSAVVTSRRVGTLAYMAPEQLASGLITPAVDIWALGVVMFELATGRLPFDEFSDGRLPQLVDTPLRASDLAPISPALSSLIASCLERDPGRRPASMTEVARVLREPAGESGERITADVGAIPPGAPPVIGSQRSLAPVASPPAMPASATYAVRSSSDDLPTTRDLMPVREADDDRSRWPMKFLVAVIGLSLVIVAGAVAIAKLAFPDAAPAAKAPAALPEPAPTPVEMERPSPAAAEAEAAPRPSSAAAAEADVTVDAGDVEAPQRTSDASKKPSRKRATRRHRTKKTTKSGSKTGLDTKTGPETKTGETLD